MKLAFESTADNPQRNPVTLLVNAISTIITQKKRRKETHEKYNKQKQGKSNLFASAKTVGTQITEAQEIKLNIGKRSKKNYKCG